jgi:NAD(P)-dependent dehydrogenase (short-subunit alcohol dehydrogenase family)
MMMRFDGKIALVTGGSSGIGLATAKLLISEGAIVFITARRQRELQAAILELGGAAIGVQGDMARLADLDELFEEIKSRHGRLDIVFANAGRGEFAPLGDITEAHFDETFALNVKGTLFTIQKALPLLTTGSSIILNSSIAGSKGFAAFSVYAATKAAIRSFARGWSVDLRDRQIRVNAVSPGTIPTPGYENLGLTHEQMTAFLAAQSAAIPMGRVGTPEEVARAVLFLASSDSSYVNGIELFVDGGVAQI